MLITPTHNIRWLKIGIILYFYICICKSLEISRFTFLSRSILSHFFGDALYVNRPSLIFSFSRRGMYQFKSYLLFVALSFSLSLSFMQLKLQTGIFFQNMQNSTLANLHYNLYKLCIIKRIFVRRYETNRYPTDVLNWFFSKWILYYYWTYYILWYQFEIFYIEILMSKKVRKQNKCTFTQKQTYDESWNVPKCTVLYIFSFSLSNKRDGEKKGK